MDLKNICVNCFNPKSQGTQCPRCGYKDGDLAVNEVHLPPGTVLKGQYLVGRVLGCGGFGVTYLAYDINLQTQCAIKEYLPGDLSGRAQDGFTVYSYSGELAENYEYGLQRFMEEGRVLSKFAALESVVSIFDYFRENNTAYIVMEYLDGQTLGQYAKSKGGKISWNEVYSIFSPIILALDKIHMTGLIHRDISPDNIFITQKGAKLIDFGAARQAIGERSQSLSVILKPGYAPPEQYHTRGAQGPWTDVYAIGATIYKCLTGVSPTESLTRMVGDDLRPLSVMGVSIPNSAEIAVSQSLNLDESQRFRSMDELHQSLFEGKEAPKVKQSAKLIGGGESFLEKAKYNMKKPLYIKITAVVVSAALFISLIFGVVKPSIEYRTADKLFDAQEYEDSGDIFRKLRNYKDSVMMLARSLYREGVQDYDRGDFDDAIEPFNELGDYYPDIAALATDAKYMDAVKDGLEGNYDDAIEKLNELDGYMDSEQLIIDANAQNPNAFIETVVEHVIPVTETDIVQVVAQAESYSNSVVSGHLTEADSFDNEDTVLSQPDEVSVPSSFPYVHVVTDYLDTGDTIIKTPIVTVEGNQGLSDKINVHIGRIIEDMMFRTLDAEAVYTQIDYSVTRNDGGVLSIFITCMFEWGGAHGSFVSDSINYYTDTGEEIIIAYMFNEGYDGYGVITELLYEGLVEYEEYMIGSIYEYTELTGIEVIYFTDDSMVIFYEQGDAAIWAAGPIEITIPYSAFGDGINQKYFSGYNGMQQGSDAEQASGSDSPYGLSITLPTLTEDDVVGDWYVTSFYDKDLNLNEKAHEAMFMYQVEEHFYLKSNGDMYKNEGAEDYHAGYWKIENNRLVLERGGTYFFYDGKLFISFEDMEKITGWPVEEFWIFSKTGNAYYCFEKYR